jgi:hypothetical protein
MANKHDDISAAISASNSTNSDKENDGNSMGVQSQNRRKSTTVTKHRPNYIVIDNKNKKAKKTQQLTLFGVAPPTEAFSSIEECDVCRAKHIGCRVPRRPHHVRCNRNSEYGALRLSAKQAAEVERAEKLRKAINEPLPETESQKHYKKVFKEIARSNAIKLPIHLPITNAKESAAFFEPRTTKMSANNNIIDRGVEADSTTNNNNSSIVTGNDSNINNSNNMTNTNNSIRVNYDEFDATSSNLRAFVDDNMQQFNDEKSTAKEPNCPLPIFCIAKYIRDYCMPPRLNSDNNDIPITQQAVQAMANFNSLFPTGNMEFIIPKESKAIAPSPHYHSIEGHKLLIVIWELNCPGITLGCIKDNCLGSLIHDRTNFSKDGELFPIFESGAPHMWAVVMHYKCNCCDVRVAGNAGELLMKLPPHIRDAYPVYPRYAEGNFHLAKSTSDLMEDVIVTYGSGDYFSRSLYQRLNLVYYRNADNYYEQCVYLNLIKVNNYPDFATWIGIFYPDGAKFRSLYERAQESQLTRTGYSEMERYTREIQSVESRVSIAQDHTMEMIKNYLPSDLGNAKACWTCCNEFGEVAAAVIVKDTKCSQFAHAVEQLARRNNFRPKVMYADTWPNLENFWRLILGFECVGRLGLFHYLQRIIKTLRDSHCDYRKAIVDLCQSTYNYNEIDNLRLLNALKSGTMAKNGHKYTDLEISELQISGVFKRRYDKWLRKTILDTPTLRTNLEQWFIQYKVKASDGRPEGRGRLDPVSRKKLFTPETKDAVENAMRSCQYISDVLTVDDMYTTLPPSPYSTHGLNEHMSHRVESRLEGYHNPLSNFGNSGMRRNLADILHSCGTAKYNSNIRRKIIATKMSEVERKKVPAYFLTVPGLYNHGEMAIVNNNALRVGIDEPPFKHVRVPVEDTGERFFSRYLTEQSNRNVNVAPHLNNDRCQCTLCGKNPTPMLHEVAVPMKMAGLDDHGDVSETGAVSPRKKRRKKKNEMVVSESVVPVVASSGAAQVPPMMVQQPYCYPAMPFVPPMMNPFMMMPYATTTMQQVRKTQQEYCCLPYYRYIMSSKPRVGRPPHDTLNCLRLKSPQSFY